MRFSVVHVIDDIFFDSIWLESEIHESKYLYACENHKRSFWLRYNKKKKNWLLPAFAFFKVVANGSWNIRSGSVVANHENNSNLKKRDFSRTQMYAWILCHFIIPINLFGFRKKLDRSTLANPSYWTKY